MSHDITTHESPQQVESAAKGLVKFELDRQQHDHPKENGDEEPLFELAHVMGFSCSG